MLTNEQMNDLAQLHAVAFGALGKWPMFAFQK